MIRSDSFQLSSPTTCWCSDASVYFYSLCHAKDQTAVGDRGTGHKRRGHRQRGPHPTRTPTANPSEQSLGQQPSPPSSAASSPITAQTSSSLGAGTLSASSTALTPGPGAQECVMSERRTSRCSSSSALHSPVPPTPRASSADSASVPFHSVGPDAFLTLL